MVRQRNMFTLIELLVVIAIIKRCDYACPAVGTADSRFSSNTCSCTIAMNSFIGYYPERCKGTKGDRNEE